MPPQLAVALATVPRRQNEATDRSPRLARVDAKLESAKPQIAIDVAYPAGTDGADVFIEAGSETYLPMASKNREMPDGTIRYVVDLSNGIDLKALRGKELQLTLVSAAESIQILHRLP